MPLPDLNAPAGGYSDMFLHVKSARAGVIKGEAQDGDHKGEIEVVGWSWGMEIRNGLSGGPAQRASIRELHVRKRIDSASTALMSALRSNDLISKAVLTLRKSGSSRLEYFKITIENGRVTELDIAMDNNATVVEHLRLSFNKITVEYVPQGKDGLPQGSMMFSDQFGADT